MTTLARLLTRHGNRVGAVFYGTRVERTIPARGGRIQVLRLINDLLSQPRLEAAPFTDLTPLLQAGQHAIKGRSLVFVISDFISAPGWERSMNLLSQRHEVLAVRLFDRREVELPDVGPLIMEDAETGEQLYVDTHDKAFRARFQAAAEQRETTLRTAFKRSGVDVVSLSPDEDLVAAIVRMAALRQRRRRSHVVHLAADAGARGTDPAGRARLPCHRAPPPAGVFASYRLLATTGEHRRHRHVGSAAGYPEP